MRRMILCVALTFAALPLMASVDLRIALNTAPPYRYDPGQLVTISFFAGNRGTEAVPATIVVPLPVGATFTGVNIPSPYVAGDVSCSQPQGADVVCTRTFTAAATFVFELGLTMPADTRGGQFVSHPAISSALSDSNPADNVTTFAFTVYRTFHVTTGDDFGPGTLRDAITNANARCDRSVPCKIRFAGPMTIQPLAPLPAVTGCDLLIDGGVPSTATLDEPRPVEINGAKAGPSNGLMLDGNCPLDGGLEVRGITVNGFAFNGIAITGTSSTIDGCFIGTDFTGSEARANGWRGVAVETAVTDTFVHNVLSHHFHDNQISGNGYSGIVVWVGQATIRSNRIGVGKDGRALGNGASGIFVSEGSISSSLNVIAYNHDMGIGVGTPAAEMTSGADLIHDNGGLPIDWYLDGPTGIDPHGRMPTRPAIFSTTYDAFRGQTVILGFAQGLGKQMAAYLVTPSGQIVASIGGRGQKDPEGFEDPNGFGMIFNKDYRGQWIAVTTTIGKTPNATMYGTSELSAPFLVQ